MEELGELPPGWAWARLGDLVERIESGKNVMAEGRPPVEGETGIVKVSAVTWGEFDEDQSKALFRGADWDEANLIKPGDFLISRANTVELVGAPVIVKTCRRRLVLSDKVLRVVFLTDVARWVELFLKSFAGRQQIEAFSQGAQLSMRNLSQDNLRRITVPLAPEAEAKRILSSCNPAFTDLDEAEAALSRARAGLAEYRASLLHAACTGQLTAAWRAARPAPAEDGPALLRRILAERRAAWERAELARLDARGKLAPVGTAWKARYPEPTTLERSKLPDLPGGWTWATVDQLGMVSGGITKNNSRAEAELELPYLRVANVGEDDLRLANVSKIGVNRAELERLALQTGDVLFVEGNGSPDHIGRVAIWDGSIAPCVHQNHLIKCRPVLQSLGKLLLTWFMSPAGRQRVQAVAASTSGLYTLSITKIAALPVPLPSAAELDAMQELLPDNLAANRQTLSELDGWRQTLNSLRQSILHAAFTGRLVPQDPADEPAAALLARLRAAPAAPRARRARTQAPA